MGNRMSSLPIAQWCSAAGVLADKHGAGRAAAISSAHHALAAGDPNATDLLLALTPEEREEAKSRGIPEPVVWEDGDTTVVLDWRDTDHLGGRELEVHLDQDLESIGEPESIGHVDRVWVVDVNGTSVAYVADIKATDWSSPDGLASLQLHAYGLACSALFDCDAYCVGIWNATAREWDWSEIHYLTDFDTQVVGQRVLAAARNTSGEYATGSHCHSCYNRLHCQEWLAPIADPETALTKVAAGELTPASAADALQKLKAVEDLTELVKSTLKAYADRVGGIVSEDGRKVWGSSAVKGRAGLDRKALEEAHPEIVKQYTKRGPDGVRYSWRNRGTP